MNWSRTFFVCLCLMSSLQAEGRPHLNQDGPEQCLARALEALAQRPDLATDPVVQDLRAAATGFRDQAHASKFIPAVGGSRALEAGFQSLTQWVNNSRGGAIGIIHLDLDGLKFVNDFGHSAGDDFIKLAVETLHDATLNSGTRVSDHILAYHPSGDELVVLVRMSDNKSGQVAQIAKKIHDYFSQKTHPQVQEWGRTLTDPAQIANRVEGEQDQKNVIAAFREGRISATAAYGELLPRDGGYQLEEVMAFSETVDQATVDAKKVDGNRGRIFEHSQIHP